MFWIFLPTLAAAGFFSDHVEKYLDHDVDPCDDFYGHTCSAEAQNDHLFYDNIKKSLETILSQRASPQIRDFHLRVESDIDTFPQGPMESEDNEALKAFLGKMDSNCFSYNYSDVLKGMRIYDAYYRLQFTPYYNILKKKMTDIFEVIKGILIKEFSESPWTNRYPKFMEFLHSVKLLHLEAKDFQMDKEIEAIQQKYEECLGVAHNLTSVLAAHCISFAACPMNKTLGHYLENDLYQKDIWRNFEIDYNAFYEDTNHVIVPSPMFYTMEEDDLPYMLGALDFVLGHELGHVFFIDEVILSNSECLRRHMEKTCHSYLGEDSNCNYTVNGDCQPQVNGNYSRLGDDAADWIGMHAGLKALKHYFPKLFNDNSTNNPESLEIMKKFYYSHAIQWCTRVQRSDYRHSPPQVRANGISSLFSEFSEVFQCMRGSRMAKAATCLPFAGAGAPTRRSGHSPCPI